MAGLNHEGKLAKASVEHTKEISRTRSTAWRQTVQGMYSEEYQAKKLEYWYNHKRVRDEIVRGVYTHVAIVDDKVVGTIGGVMSAPEVSEIFVFYVDEAFRYVGIGTQLLDTFTAEDIKKVATEQYVSVEDGNKLGLPI